MRSSADLLMLAGALALGGCSSAWWRDPPAATADAGRPLPAATATPDPYAASDWSTSGTSYAAPDATPAPRADPSSRPSESIYDPAARLRPGPSARPPEAAYDPPPPPAQAVRYDNVGYAVWSAEPGTVAAAHPSLPFGSFAEVTSIDTGKTIIVPITARSRPGREIELSGAAAHQLGLGRSGGQAGVRVRAANASGGDIAALKAGQPAPARPDTPPVLLNALRRKLAGTLGQADSPPGPAPLPDTRAPVDAAPAPARRPAPRPTAPTPKSGPGYYVQLAALSDAARARTLAQEAGGTVSSGGGLHRVRFGPFDDLKTAQAARDDVARRGYGDARIVRQD